MGKTQQPELKLQAKLIPCLQSQGFLATKTSDRFKAGRPDLRIGRHDLGQLDVELKYLTFTMGQLWCEPEKPLEFDTGLSKLQWLKMRDMNSHGMPAVGLLYVEASEMFVVTTLLRDSLTYPLRFVKKGPSDGNLIDGAELFSVAHRYLKGDFR